MTLNYIFLMLAVSVHVCFSLYTMDIGQLYRQLEQQEVGQDNIKLISKEGAEFIVPLAVAKQSETIKHLLSDLGTNQLSFDTISAGTLKEIIELLGGLNVLPKPTSLEGKSLLDAFDTIFVIKDSVALLNAANYLDINPVIQLAARKVAQQEKERIAGEYKITRFFKAPEIAKKLPKDLLKIVAHYYFLLTGKNYPGIAEPNYNFSIQDYLDYLPNKLLKTHPDTLNFQHLNLTSLEGLQKIVDKDSIRILELNYNKLKVIDENDIAGFFHLERLNLDYNRITKVQLPDLPKLGYLKLNNNLLTEIPELHLKKLHYLNVRYNLITDINNAYPKGLDNLQILHIEFNKIIKIKPKMFSMWGTLHQIYLQNCDLTAIEPEAFVGLPLLDMLDLQYNPLTYIPPTAFDPAVRQNKLIIYFNNSLVPGNVDELYRKFFRLEIKPKP